MHKGLRVLDIGIGTAIFWDYLRKYVPGNIAVEGIDICKEMINEAKNKRIPFLSVSLMDGARLGYRDESFDLAICAFTIRHFPSLMSFLAEVYRVLKKGGTFFVADYLMNSDPMSSVIQQIYEEVPELPKPIKLECSFMLADSELRRSFKVGKFQGESYLRAQTYAELAEYLVTSPITLSESYFCLSVDKREIVKNKILQILRNKFPIPLLERKFFMAILLKR